MSSRKGERRLNAQERALWEKVVRNATPMRKPEARKEEEAPAAFPLHEPAKTSANVRLPEDFRIGVKAGKLQTAVSPSTAPATAPRMDAKVFGRMKRGKLVPEARLDLHGMTLAAAQPALTRFVLRAQAEGKRLVLVITGKGRQRDEGGPIPARTGALRHEVPAWLRSGAVAGAVLDVTEAHARHGGSGAYYVYLRRLR